MHLPDHQRPDQRLGKRAAGWFPLTGATVYLDHPVDAPATHTLNIDFRNFTRGPERVAVELDPAAARELAGAILEMQPK